MSDNTCAVCGSAAVQCCANCRAVRYCSKAHQRVHWNGGHKAACRPFRVVSSSVLGRHWVAARDVAPGEVLLEEKPLATGPKAGSRPVCLTCYAPLPERGGYTCSACGWPMCGTQCETAPVHRTTECPLIAGRYDPGRAAAAAYCFVLPLRCMLLDERRCRKFRSLQSHIDDRLDTPLYRAYAVNVAKFVLDQLGLRSSGGHDERSALEAAAILDTNAFDVRRAGGRNFRAVYDEASMMAHSCTANTKHVFIGDVVNGWPSIRVLATMPIGRGCPITATYTHTLWCTRDRRQHLITAKCFRCVCPRCEDPTELGTHIGSVACRTCNAVQVVAESVKHCWPCQICGRQTDGNAVEAEQQIRSLDRRELFDFEQFVEQVHSDTMPPLHANHYTTVSVKYALAQLYDERITGE